MVLHILYPADYFKPKKVDEAFRDEAEAFRELGYVVRPADVDALVSGDGRLPDLGGVSVLYRGWMLGADGYSGLVAAIRRAGGEPFTSVEAYLSAHHLPNWLPHLADLTAETVVLPNGTDFEAALRELDWNGFFIKDYVKSLKTSMGSRISDPSRIGPLVEEMRKFRGDIEGGLCVRRIEDFVDDSERRYFVLNGRPVSPDGTPVPPIVETCAARIDSPFFSVDVAELGSGELRVVEIGDGQVSDRVGWTVERFIGLFRDA